MPTDYTKWPTTVDVGLRLTAAGFDGSTRISGAFHYQQTIDAVVGEVETYCRRQFVADTVAVLRYFDGSGTPEQEVDEFVALTQVQIVGWAGLITPMTVDSAVAAEENTLPNTRILLYRGSAPIVQGYYIDRWPQGRQNIGVTATWGYGATIPAALWKAVEGEAAGRIAEELRSSGTARLASIKLNTNTFEFDRKSVGEGLMWTPTLWRVARTYRRPDGRRLRAIKSPMV